jgi:hypothetical protein
MFDDLNFCPFCGRKLVSAANADVETKLCEGTFHFLIQRAEDTEIL